jgi:tetratricopeptide (TPR) repeat protein
MRIRYMMKKVLTVIVPKSLVLLKERLLARFWDRFKPHREPATLFDLRQEDIDTMPLDELNRIARRTGIDPLEVSEELHRRVATVLARYDRKASRLSPTGRAPKRLTISAPGDRWPAVSQLSREIPNHLVSQIARAVASRDVATAMRGLRECANRMRFVSPQQKNAASLLGYFAWAIDLEPSYLSMVKSLMPKFQRADREQLDFKDRIHLEIAEGLTDLHEERMKSAIRTFRSIVVAADQMKDLDMMIISRYYLGRAYWKEARYVASLPIISQAIELHKGLDCPERLGVIQTVRGWLLFQLGSIHEAKASLHQAEANLSNSSDPISKGDLLSCYGRIAQEDGHLDMAIDLFWKAIDEYKAYHPQHTHVARTYVHMAKVCHLKIAAIRTRADSRREIVKIVWEARNHLNAAEQIYKMSPMQNNRGVGKICLARALLYGDVDMRDLAQLEAVRALELGERTGDHILLGGARRIQCKNERDPSRALEFGEAAIQHAQRTHNIRLQARAYILCSNLLRKPPYNNKAESIRKAEEYWQKGHNCLPSAVKNRPYWLSCLEAYKSPASGNTGISSYCL